MIKSLAEGAVVVTAEQTTLEDLGGNKVQVTITQAAAGPTAACNL